MPRSRSRSYLTPKRPRHIIYQVFKGSEDSAMIKEKQAGPGKTVTNDYEETPFTG